jgi:hypothetical protein
MDMNKYQWISVEEQSENIFENNNFVQMEESKRNLINSEYLF